MVAKTLNIGAGVVVLLKKEYDATQVMTDEKYEKIKSNFKKVELDALLRIVELPKEMVEEAIEKIKNT